MISHDEKYGWILASPYIVFFLIISAFPILFSAVLIFMRWNMLSPMTFIGMQNFITLFQDPLFWKSLINTGLFLGIHIPLQIGLALLISALLNNPSLKGKSVFRSAFFLPVVISGVVVTILWKQLYSTETGLLNSMLLSFGVQKVPWLTNTKIAMPAIALMATWKNLGLYVVMLLAGLQNIPRSLYEAAGIDGAGKISQFFHITVPMINPILIMVIVLSTIGGFSLFIEPYIMTGGGPLNSTLSVNLYIYQQAFSFYKMGYAATLGITMAAIIFAVVTLERKLFERNY
ncbi:MAG: sugar ABC transporter permease [FCB group bacterium]|nr:sugar ABC transporter permease [FCB group bacterium]